MSANADTQDRFERFLRWTIEVEFPSRERFLTPELAASFTDYYKRLPAAGDERAIRRMLRGMWRGDSGWVCRWLASHPGKPQVLDAGSGFGTFAMLFAAVGAEVTAVDLRPDRLEGADRRLAHYRERTGKSLAVRNMRADLTRDWQRSYDLVWVYNALSHIDPLDPFLQSVCAHLAPGGVLAVGDINGANSGHQKRLARLRDRVHQEYVAPDGQRHTYAVERTFTPTEMREVMSSNGLAVVHQELYWRGQALLPEILYAGVVRPLQARWPWGERLARRQLVVASRAAERS